jgi:thioredoxin 1
MKKSLLLLFASFFLIACGQSTVNYLDASEFSAKMSAVPGKIIDVRTPVEFAESRIAGAENFNLNDGSFTESISQWDKNEVYFIYCLSGGRSNTAAERMAAEGFKKVYALRGGLLTWRNKGLPEIKKNQVAANAEMTWEELENILRTNKNVLVDYYAEWCGPCKKMKPDLDRLAKEYENELQVIRIDVDKNPSLAAQFKIEAIPHLIGYQNAVEIWNHLGYADYPALKTGMKF